MQRRTILILRRRTAAPEEQHGNERDTQGAGAHRRILGDRGPGFNRQHADMCHSSQHSAGTRRDQMLASARRAAW